MPIRSKRLETPTPISISNRRACAETEQLSATVIGRGLTRLLWTQNVAVFFVVLLESLERHRVCLEETGSRILTWGLRPRVGLSRLLPRENSVSSGQYRSVPITLVSIHSSSVR